MQNWTEQDYYEMIEDALNQPAEDHRHPDYPVDHVAGIEDWGLFRSALMRWLAEQDREHFEGHRVHLEEEAEAKQRHLRPVRD